MFDLLCSRSGAAGFAYDRGELLCLLQVSIRAIADRAYDSFLQIPLNKCCKRLLIWPTHENGPTIFNRSVYRKLAPEVVQKLVRIPPQYCRELDKIQPVCLLSRHHSSRLREFQTIFNMRSTFWPGEPYSSKEAVVLLFCLFNFCHFHLLHCTLFGPTYLLSGSKIQFKTNRLPKPRAAMGTLWSRARA